MNENIQNNNGINNNGSVPVGNVTNVQPVLSSVPQVAVSQGEPQIQNTVQPQVQPMAQGQSQVVSQPQIQPMITGVNLGENVSSAPVVQPLPNANASTLGVTAGNINSPIGSVPLDQIRPREEQAIINKDEEVVGPPVAVMSTPNNDDGVVVDENLKKVEIDYKPPSKAKTIGLILLFVLLIGFVLFLPEISDIVSKVLDNYNNPQAIDDTTVITSGRLICDLNTNTANFDKNYQYTFSFTESKLYKSELTITTRGDASLDEEELNNLNNSCLEIEELTKTMSGISISCNYSEGKLIERQLYDLQVVDMSQVTSAFVESGGSHPEYAYGEDIGLIERNMNSSGYSCQRQR